MSDETISMNFPSMDLMISACKDGAQAMGEIEAKIKDLASQIENGALQGKAGDTLRDALRDNLAKRVADLREKLIDLEKDITEAVHQLQNADEISGGYYKG